MGGGSRKLNENVQNSLDARSITSGCFKVYTQFLGHGLKSNIKRNLGSFINKWPIPEEAPSISKCRPSFLEVLTIDHIVDPKNALIIG